MRKTISGLAILIIIGFTAGCYQEKIEEKKTIRIGIDVFPGWGHMFIAQEKGFFKKNGVEIEIVLNEDYLTIQDQFANGELDGAFMVYTDALYANGQGVATKVVYISDHSIKGDVIASKPEFTSLKDLKGKTISVEGINSFSHVFVLAVLEKSGLKETDIFFKNIGAQEVVGALERGEIDAGHTYGRGKAEAKEKGYVYLAYAGDVPGIITDVLAFNAKTVEMRPEEIKAIVKSLFEAKRFQKANREEALAIIAKAIKDTPESVAAGVDAVDYLYLEENAHAMIEEEKEEGQEALSLIESGKLITDFYLKRGQLSQVPNFDEIIEPRFVNELSRGQRDK